GMVLQARISGQLLSDVTDSTEMMRALIIVAQQLAQLHNLAPVISETRDVEDHVKKYCHPGPNFLKERHPEFSGLLTDILSYLQDAADNAESKRPVHGDLNPRQIYMNRSHCKFVDFDGVCNADPALDVGNLLAAIEVYWGESALECSRAFLARYLEMRAADTLRSLPFYLGFAYFRRAMICFRKNPGRDSTRIRELLEMSASYLQGQGSLLQ
ncbi:aminoglycoside phosphotransferase family protein, partial [bacterium]|nr:aminoglycoside phosphotransferase family protein [bacterium]